jgi:hypothetical protein
MAGRQFFIAAWLTCGAMAVAAPTANAMPSPLQVERVNPVSHSGSIRLAQAAPAQPGAPQAPAAPSAAAPAEPAAAASDPDPIGNVATLTGSATVIRNKNSLPLKIKDDIYLNDVLRTSADSTLGVTFNDETTFNLTANARITVDNYVYEEGGSKNAALFNIAKGTVAFVASAVAKTGDMQIATPTATLGIRGTTGLVEVPEGASATGQNNVAIKLYPDPDGKVGHIEVNGRDGTRLGLLSQGATGFAIRPGAGARFAAVPLAISPRQAVRDQGFVRQVHAAQAVGRQVVTQRRQEIRNNPALRNNPARQPVAPQPNGLPKQNGLPKPTGQPKQNALPKLPGQPKQNALPKPTGQPKQNALPKPPGQPKQNPLPKQPGPPVQPAQPAPPRPPALQRQGAPSLQRPARPFKPAAPPRRPAAPKKKLPNQPR